MTLRFHVQTAGSTLTAQQPETNTVRTTVQALAAVLGGAQSLHTNALDEALGLPSPEAARLALRTQQVLAYETGVDRADRPAGRVVVRRSPDRCPGRARIGRAGATWTSCGGPLAAMEAGYQAGAIADAAYADQRAFEAGELIVVGVNRFADPGEAAVRPQPQRIDPAAERAQAERTRAVRDSRDADRRRRRARGAAPWPRRDPRTSCPGSAPASEAEVTLGEIADALRAVWGEYRP